MIIAFLLPVRDEVITWFVTPVLPLVVAGLAAALAGGWLSDYLLRKTRAAHYLVSAVSLGLGIPAMWIAIHASGRPMVAAIFIAELGLMRSNRNLVRELRITSSGRIQFCVCPTLA